MNATEPDDDAEEGADPNVPVKTLDSIALLLERVDGSTLVAVAVAFGFVVGAVTLGAFSVGLGVPVLDLGIDLQGYVVVAAGTLFLPALLAAAVLFGRLCNRLGFKWQKNETTVIWYVVLVIAFGLVLIFGTVPFVFSGVFGIVAGLAICVSLAFAVMLAVVGGGVFLLNRLEQASDGVEPPDGEDETDDEDTKLLYLILGGLVLAVSLVLVSGFGFVWGMEVRNGHASRINGPLTLELVAPATRGVISVNGKTACVDRVGKSVVFGSDRSAVVTQVDWFEHDSDCDRDALAQLLEEEDADDGE